MGLDRAATGIMAALLAIATALLVIAAKALGWALSFAWRHRQVVPHIDVILGALGALLAYSILAMLLGDTPALILTAAAAAAAWFLRDSIRFRLKWSAAIKRFGLERVRVDRIEETPAGQRITVTFAKGQHAGYLERHTGDLASIFDARSVRVFSRPENMREGTIYIVERDPLEDLGGQPWPLLGAERASLWEPTPIGVDEHGATVTVTLAGHNLMLSGEPGAGKTISTQLLVAAAALDRDVELVILDGKQVDLTDWRLRCRAFAGADLKDATAALRDAQDWMAAAYDRLREQGRKKVAPGDPLLVVVCDELAYYVGAGRAGKAITAQLRDLVQRGRAAGVIVLAATQRPSASVIDTSLRDLFAYRHALRCTTPAASDMALGEGQASRGFDATTIPTGQRGTGYLLAEGGHPTRMRSYLLTDEDVAAIAARAPRATTPQPQGEAHRTGLPVLPPPADVPDGRAADVQNFAGAEVPPVGDSEPAKLLHSEPVPPDDASEPARRHLTVVPDESNPRAVLQFKVALELRDHEGDSDRAIAKRLGCSGPTVAAARKRLGLPPSSKSKRSA